MSIERISKLLHMAERAKNPDEAAAFFAKAQAIATTHEISLAEARQHQPQRERTKPVQQIIRVGKPRQQANRHYLRLLVALAKSNGCEIGLYNNNTGAVVFGLPTDILTVERMFAVIAPQMIRFGEEHLHEGRWRSEIVLDLQTGLPRPATRQAARAAFYRGFTDTLSRRITVAAQEVKEAAEDLGSAESSSTAVALRAKELEIREFAKPFLGGGSWRGDRRPSSMVAGSYRAGDQAAGRVRLGDEGALPGGRRELAG